MKRIVLVASVLLVWEHATAIGRAEDGSLVVRVRQRIAMEDFSGALSTLREAQVQGWDSSEILVLRGECLLERFRRDSHPWDVSAIGPVHSSTGQITGPVALQRSEKTARQYRARLSGQMHPDLLAAHEAFLSARNKGARTPSLLGGLARTYYFLANKNAALDALNRAVGPESRDAELLFMRGVTLMSLAKYRESRADLSRVVALVPEHVDARRWLLALEYLAGDVAASRTHETWFLQHADLATRNIRDASAFGYVLIMIDGQHPERQFDGQLTACLAEIVRRFPARWESWMAHGNLLTRRDEHKQAEAALTRSLELLPARDSLYRVYRYRAIVRQRLEDWSGALEDLAMAIQLEPLSAICYEDYNRSLRMLGRFDEIPAGARRFQDLVTLFEFHRKLDLRPDEGELWTDYSGHLLAMGELDWALASFDRTTELLPESAAPVLGTAQVLLDQGKGEAAVTACNRAIQLGAGRKAVSLRGDAWLNLKKPTQALADFETAQRFDEAVADAWLLLARQHLKSGDRAAATEATGRALKISPERREEVARLLDSTSRD